MTHRIVTMLLASALFSLALFSLGLFGLAVGSPAPVHAEAKPETQKTVREVEITVKGGYQPGRIELRQGEHVRLKFVRKEYNNCTREVVFPKLDIKRELPTNKPVLIDLPLLAPGEYEFHCGMNMIKGLLVVLPS
jgi:plastocyanin domain-containing protein